MAGIHITNQSDLHLDKLAELAVGKLYKALGLVNQTTVWKTNAVVQNGGTWNIPIIGDLTTNVRAPGDPVVDQVPTPARRAITIQERESSFQVDATHNDSEAGVNYIPMQIETAVNAVAQDIMRDMLQVISLTGGLTTVGTLATPLAKADMDAARRALSDNSIPDAPRIAVVSTDMMTDLTNIPEFSRMDANGVPNIFSNGMVRMAAGFQVMESPYVHEPNPGVDHRGFGAWPESIYSVFPKQGDIGNPWAEKAEAEIDGIRMSILREYVPGFNGAFRYTVSSRAGFRVGRDEGVVLIEGN